MEAIDADGPGLNSEVSYDKGGEDGDKFSVDFRTGIVTVAPGTCIHCNDCICDSLLQIRGYT